MAKTVEDFIFSQPMEQFLEEIPIEGQLPAFLKGTCYMNGPARFHQSPVPQRHWLDGDGLARAIGFAAGKASYQSRFIGTHKYHQEVAADSALYRTFGTQFQGDLLREGLTLETPANVSLYLHNHRLFAFGEQSLPWELEPDTLETLGEMNFSGRFSPITPLSAHPKFDPDKGEMHSFGITYFGRKGKLSYYRFDANCQLQARGESLLKEGNYVHDFALSPQYACFHLAPYQLDIHGFVKKELPLLEALNWHPEGYFGLKIFSRNNGRPLADIPLERQGFCLHSINAWEEGHLLNLDLVETRQPFFDQYRADPLMFSKVLACAAIRYQIDTRTWTIQEKHLVESPWHFDFPSIGQSAVSKAYSCFWAAAMPAVGEPAPKFYNRLFRFNWSNFSYEDSWQTRPGLFLGGQPQVIENPDRPEEAVVLTQYLDLANGRSGYYLFDAFNLKNGPITRFPLPFYDPLGFHTSWVYQ